MATITEDFEQSFIELKSGLKDKYTSILRSFIDEKKKSVLESLQKLLGNDFVAFCEQTKILQDDIVRQKTEFYNSVDYKSKVDNLARLSSRYSSCKDDEKDEVKKQMIKAFSEVTTLNITIKNRLKDLTEKLKANKAIIRQKNEEFKDDLEKLKKEVMDKLRNKIAICVIKYREELAELLESFEKPVNVDKESPFDLNTFKLNEPIFSTINYEENNEEKGESSDKSTQTFIVSENDDIITN